MILGLKFKDGVVLKSAHFLPHVVLILESALVTAPITEDGYVWVTQAHRDIRPSLDFHEHNQAFDFRCKNIVASDHEAIVVSGHAWAGRMRAMLGDNYDVLAHGQGDHFHVHAEFDPR